MNKAKKPLALLLSLLMLMTALPFAAIPASAASWQHFTQDGKFYLYINGMFILDENTVITYYGVDGTIDDITLRPIGLNPSTMQFDSTSITAGTGDITGLFESSATSRGAHSYYFKGTAPKGSLSKTVQYKFAYKFDGTNYTDIGLCYLLSYSNGVLTFTFPEKSAVTALSSATVDGNSVTANAVLSGNTISVPVGKVPGGPIPVTLSLTADGSTYNESYEIYLNKDGTATDGYTTDGEEPETPSVDLSKLKTGAKIQLGTYANDVEYYDRANNRNIKLASAGEPVEWVIGGDGTTGMSAPEGCIALVSSGIVAGEILFDLNETSNVYASSNLRTVIESAVAFTTDEQKVIRARTLGTDSYKDDEPWCDGVAGDPVTATVWAPTTKDANALMNADLSKISFSYWLCSPGTAQTNAGRVHSGGTVAEFVVYGDNSVRAGLYLDLSKITNLTLVEGTTDTYIVNAPEEETHTHNYENGICSCGEHNTDHTDWTAIDSADKLTALFTNGGKGYLTSNITVSDTLTSSNKDITLCLNGYIIDLNGKYINPVGDSFTLYDCNSTNQTHKFKKAEKGAAQTLDENGEYVYNCGVITNGGSGAIKLGNDEKENGCSFVMHGGGIIGNVSSSNGGGVFVNKFSSFIMKGGYIAGNHSHYYGGGVYIASYNRTDTPFFMTGGSIINNSISRNYGGGVYIDSETKGYFGGTAVVKDNLCIPENEEYGPQRESNVGVSSYGGKMYIADGANAPKNGMEVGTSGYSVEGGKEGDQIYIFADQDPYVNNAFTWVNEEYFSGMSFVKAGAKANGHNYANIADAVLAVKNKGTITLLADTEEETITVDRTVTFTLDKDEFTNNATIAAGEGLNLTVNNNTYYIGNHTHSFDNKYSSDANGHWYACTAEDCYIEDYSTCGIEEAAYAAHTGMGDFVCDVCEYFDSEGKLSAKSDAVDAVNALVKSTDSDTIKALAAEAEEKIAAAETAEEIENIVDEYTDKINYRKLFDSTSAEFNIALKSDGYSDEMKAIITDALAEMENTETYDELCELLEEVQDKAELQQTRESFIAQLEEIIDSDIYSDKIEEMAKQYIEDSKKIDNLEDFEAFFSDCDKKMAHQFFKDAACKEILDYAGEKPSEEVMKIVNDAMDEIQNTEETPDFDDIYMELFENIIALAKKDIDAHLEAEAKALADAKTAAKAELEAAKKNAKSDEAKAAIDTAIANVEKATSPEAVASAKSTGTTAAATADKALADAQAAAKAELETAKANAKSDAAKAAIDTAIANVEKAESITDVNAAETSGKISASQADNMLADAKKYAKEYLENEKKNVKSDEAKAALDKAFADVEKATNPTAVNQIMSAGARDASLADNTLANMKSSAKTALESAKADAKSDAAKAAIDNAIKAVDEATNVNAVTSAKTTGTTAAAAADKALADAKTAAKAELETAKANAKSDEAKAAVDDAIKAVDNATNPDAVASAKTTGTTAAAAADKALADAKAETKAALEDAKKKAVSDEAKAAVDKALAGIEATTNLTDTAAAKADGLKNAADADKALADAKADAKSALETAKENAVSDEAKAAVDKAIEDMDNATSLTAVADKKAAAEKAAETADKELADAKAEAIKAVEALAGENPTDDVKQLVENAKEAINSATGLNAVDTAEDNSLAAVEHKQKEEGFTVPDLDIQLGYREASPVNAESTTNKIIFTSNNESVVTVDEDGNLKAVGKGKATVTATLEGTDISEEIEIEVNYTFWDVLVWHIRNLLDLIASGFKWLLALIGINL